MRLVPRWWRQTDGDEIRATIATFEAAGAEMVRLTMPSGVSFVGYPRLFGRFVILLGRDGVPRHTVRLGRVDAVSRVFWANRPTKEKMSA